MDKIPKHLKRRPSLKKRNERHYDDEYRSAIRSIGGRAWKLEPKFKGWPDTYIAPNIHIEFKWIWWFSEENISPAKHFEPLQLHHLRELSRQGCRCFVGIFWGMGEAGDFFQLVDFKTFEAHQIWMKRSMALPFSWPIDELREHVRQTWEITDEGAKIRASAIAQTQLTK